MYETVCEYSPGRELLFHSTGISIASHILINHISAIQMHAAVEFVLVSLLPRRTARVGVLDSARGERVRLV